MVTKKLIKSYDFETIEEYYEYIVNSEINGQRSQVESLIKALSKEQKKDCLSYLNEFGSNDVAVVKKLIVKSL